MPVELDALEEWGVGQRLLEGVLAGAELDGCMQAEIARGALPPGRARPSPPLAQIRPRRRAARRRGADARRRGAPGSLDVSLALPDGRTLAGTVTGVCGDTIRDDLLLAGQAARPAARLGAAARAERRAPGAAVRVGRDRPRARRARGAGVTVARIPRSPTPGRPAAGRARAARGAARPLRPRHARAAAARLRDVRRVRAGGGGRRGRGGRRARRLGDRVRATTRRTASPSTCSCYGDVDPPRRLLAEAPARRRAAWDEAETTRFGRYALPAVATGCSAPRR